MAFTYGFYNSFNGDRKYDAVQLSSIFDGIIKDGVFASIGDAFAVKESENENEVIVQPGKAWFSHTWSYNDADLPVKAEQSSLALHRIDALVLDIDSSLEVRENKIIFIKGLEAEEEELEKPDLNPATLPDEHHRYPLAYIHRYPNEEHIYQKDITSCIGTDECPLVTGILETISLDVLLGQWRGDLDKFVSDKETEFETWSEAEKQAFVDWFENLKVQLEGDVAANLQLEVEAATSKKHKIDVLAEAWVEQEDGSYTQDFTIEGIRDDTEFGSLYSLVDTALTMDETEDLSSAIGCIKRVRTSIGNVKLICPSDKPDMDIHNLVLTEVK